MKMTNFNKTGVFLFGILLSLSVSAQKVSYPTSKGKIKKVMKSVCDWQLANPKHEPWHWTNGAFYAGVSALYQTSQDKTYLEAMKSVGESTNWEPGPRLRHADDYAICQTYVDYSRLVGDASLYKSFQDSVDKMMAGKPEVKRIKVIDWWWCDALFMAPPAFVKLYKETNDKKYLDYNNKLWKECYDLLWDEEESLFARDLDYVIKEDGSGKREKNGEKVFWSRGNGWVLGGLVRVMEELPADDPSRDFYLDVFKKMAKRIIDCQQEDGFWKSSLLDPEAYPVGETSGTGFYCYALSWGVNQGILDKATYLPSIKNSWAALNGAVHPNGKLGYTQQIGKDPKPTTEDSWEVYGAGAFLLAGSEVIKLGKDLK